MKKNFAKQKKKEKNCFVSRIRAKMFFPFGAICAAPIAITFISDINNSHTVYTRSRAVASALC